MRGEALGGQVYRHVVYNSSRWEILRAKRERAAWIMQTFVTRGFSPVVYGSLARGDVNDESDIDVFLQGSVNPELVQTIVEEELGGWTSRLVVQATPRHVVKGYIYLDELTTVSFPMVEMLPREEEFYSVAGRLGYDGLKSGRRVPGMNKSMMAIIPVEDGHMEFPATSDPDLAARLIGVNPLALRERIAVLSRRRRHGRTGTYREIRLDYHDSFAAVLRRLCDENPYLRRRGT